MARKEKKKSLKSEPSEKSTTNIVELSQDRHIIHDTSMDGNQTAGTPKTTSIVLNFVQDGVLRGMEKWIADYYTKRPGLKVLMNQVDEFIADFEALEEKERQEREASAAEEGWTVVVHQKGRKKTTDTESGTTVGAVATEVAERNAQKKKKEAVLDFYRFQQRETRRNEVLELQKRFEEDKKRISQMKAARKFRPY